MLCRFFVSSLRALTKPQKFQFAQTKQQVTNLSTDFSQILSLGDSKEQPTSGRSWRIAQLRLKSNDDLHKLWFVCVKEKNMLLADQIVEKKYSETKILHFRIDKVEKTMNRILGVVRERENIKKLYRQKLQAEYIEKKKEELREKVAKQEEQLPEITWNMLREKYLALRKGVDNVKYLERIWQKQEYSQERIKRMHERLKNNKIGKFTSFFDYQVSIGERPLQEEVLRTHIKNWRSLNLKQRKIILGFLNARRSKDAKAAFTKQLRILGDKIAQDQIKSRIQKQSEKVVTSENPDKKAQ